MMSREASWHHAWAGNVFADEIMRGFRFKIKWVVKVSEAFVCHK